MYKQPTIAL